MNSLDFHIFSKIEGHTDTMGSPEYNYDLSLKRSLSVIDAITKYSNMPKGKEIELIPAAYGESRLKIKTVQEKRCEDNRRVGIRIMPIFIDTSKKVLK
ncbi:MAG: OmpA family protein [Candidatus Cloacimonadaceae bacterium]|nr:OmpA family protein [Candidatus Cloacimonadaceae bacterium]